MGDCNLCMYYHLLLHQFDFLSLLEAVDLCYVIELFYLLCPSIPITSYTLYSILIAPILALSFTLHLSSPHSVPHCSISSSFIQFTSSSLFFLSFFICFPNFLFSSSFFLSSKLPEDPLFAPALEIKCYDSRMGSNVILGTGKEIRWYFRLFGVIYYLGV